MKNEDGRRQFLIRRISALSGRMNEMPIMLTLAEFKQILAWQRGDKRRPIQQIASGCSATEREFLISGMSPDEQEIMFDEGNTH